MRLILLFAVVASVSAYVEVQRNYHDAVGIPLAAKIKAYEEEQLKNPQTKVVGGALAPAGGQPYFGGLLILMSTGTQSVCGSSLLTPDTGVTAAHCWFDGARQAIMFTVILNSNMLWTGGSRYTTSHVILHPQWNFLNLNNDVAIYYLPTSVPLSTAIQPISLPSATEVWQTFTGHWALATGFGKTSDAQQAASTILSRVNLQVIDNAQCTAVFGSNVIIQSTLCTSGAGGVGICGGDSGGPLVVDFNGRPILIGVSSFVAAGASGTTMCQQGFPSAFARVTAFRSFIMQHI